MHFTHGTAADFLPSPRWYHRLAWWLRTRRPRTSRIVLWGHRGMDRSPRGLDVIGPAEAAPVRERFCAWLRELGLEPNEVYEIEAGTVGMRVHRWARDESGHILVVEGPDGREPKRQPPLELLYGAAGPPPSIFDSIRENTNRALKALGTRKLAA